jgi:uncharacterized membrane protein YsdA (DUF1294 family)
VPDSIDLKLEQLLEYREAPGSEAFVIDVMRSVRRERRTRRLILWVFGLVGALFGLWGASMLSGPLGQWLTVALSFPTMKIMQASLFLTGAVAFYLWFMNDDFSLGD